MKTLRVVLLALFCSTAVAGSPVAAQTGPFADGELLLHAPDPGTGTSGPWTLHRIDPTTGASSPLLADTTPSYSRSGWLAYDRYRDGVLAYVTYGPWGAFSARLLLLRADGSVTNLGFLGADIRSMAPVGDGRVYLRADGVLHLMDASNQIAPVLDSAGQPIDMPLDHLAFDAGTNALIGVAATGTQHPCASFERVTAYRLDLSPDGTSVVGAIACNSLDFGASVWPVGLDRLPNDNLLVTYVGGWLPSEGRLMEIDPATLAMSTWGAPDYADMDGGLWSQAIGKAVVLDDDMNELRTFGAGDSGLGTLLATSIAVGGPLSGVSSDNKMVDVHLTGPVCPGQAEHFGVGLEGTGGEVPWLGAGSCPRIDSVLPLTVSNAVGGGVGLVLVGLNAAALPAFGGTAYVQPPFVLSLPFALTGSPGASGAGFGELLLPIPATPSLAGATVHAQAGMLDAGAVAGVALTQGLRLVLGG